MDFFLSNYLLFSKSVADLLGMNLSAAPGVFRVGVLGLFSRPGDFLGVLEGVLRRDSLKRLLLPPPLFKERLPKRLLLLLGPAAEEEEFSRFEVLRRPESKRQKELGH